MLINSVRIPGQIHCSGCLSLSKTFIISRQLCRDVFVLISQKFKRKLSLKADDTNHLSSLHIQPIPRLQTRACEQRISNNTGIVVSNGPTFCLSCRARVSTFTEISVFWFFCYLLMTLPPRYRYEGTQLCLSSRHDLQIVNSILWLSAAHLGNHFMIWWSGAGVKPSTNLQSQMRGQFC